MLHLGYCCICLDVAWSVSVAVCCSWSQTLQKWLNWLRCLFLGGGRGETRIGPRNHVLDGGTYDHHLANMIVWSIVWLQKSPRNEKWLTQTVEYGKPPEYFIPILRFMKQVFSILAPRVGPGQSPIISSLPHLLLYLLVSCPFFHFLFMLHLSSCFSSLPILPE